MNRRALKCATLESVAGTPSIANVRQFDASEHAIQTTGVIAVLGADLKYLLPLLIDQHELLAGRLSQSTSTVGWATLPSNIPPRSRRHPDVSCASSTQ